MLANKVFLLTLLATGAMFWVPMANGQVCDASTRVSVNAKGNPADTIESNLPIREMLSVQDFQIAKDNVVLLRRMGGGGKCKPKTIFKGCSELQISGAAPNLAMNVIYQGAPQMTTPLPLHPVLSGNFVHHLVSDPWTAQTGAPVFYIYLVDEDTNGNWGRKSDVINKRYWV